MVSRTQWLVLAAALACACGESSSDELGAAGSGQEDAACYPEWPCANEPPDTTEERMVWSRSIELTDDHLHPLEAVVGFDSATRGLAVEIPSPSEGEESFTVEAGWERVSRELTWGGHETGRDARVATGLFVDGDRLLDRQVQDIEPGVTLTRFVAHGTVSPDRITVTLELHGI